MKIICNIFHLSGKIKLIAWIDTRFVKRNTLYCASEFYKIKVPEKKEKRAPNFSLQKLKGRVSNLLIPMSCILLLSYLVFKRSLALGRLIVKFFFYLNGIKIHKLKLWWSSSLSFSPGVYRWVMKLTELESEPRKIDYLPKKNIWK